MPTAESTPEIITSTKKKSNSSLALAAIIISIGAIFFSTHNFYLMMHDKNKSQKKMVSLTQSVQTEILSLKNDRDMSLQKTLADVTYLVRLANLQLIIGHEKQTALSTLLTAQTELANEQTTSLTPLKSALIADITTLRATPNIHTKQLFLTIESLQQQIQNLSSIPAKPNISLQKTIDAVKSADQHDVWYRRIAGSLAQLKTLFVIRHLDKTSTPLFSPELESALKQNIVMQLTMAQWALLHHNQTIYLSSLQNVSQALQTYFALSPAQNPMLTQLSTLEKIDIDPTLPTLNNTLFALSVISTNLPSVKKSSVQTPTQNTIHLNNKKPTASPASTSSGVET